MTVPLPRFVEATWHKLRRKLLGRIGAYGDLKAAKHALAAIFKGPGRVPGFRFQRALVNVTKRPWPHKPAAMRTPVMR